MVLGQPNCEPTMTCRGTSHWHTVPPLVRLTPHSLQQRSTLNTSPRCKLLGQLSGLTGWTCLVGDASFYVPVHKSHTASAVFCWPVKCITGYPLFQTREFTYNPQKFCRLRPVCCTSR